MSNLCHAGMCWDGEKFTDYKPGDSVPTTARLATDEEISKFNMQRFWSFESVNGEPVWTAKLATEADKNIKKIEMNASCQEFVCHSLGITVLDELLDTNIRNQADEFANTGIVNQRWGEYMTIIDSATTLVDLDFEFIWS